MGCIRYAVPLIDDSLFIGRLVTHPPLCITYFRILRLPLFISSFTCPTLTLLQVISVTYLVRFINNDDAVYRIRHNNNNKVDTVPKLASAKSFLLNPKEKNKTQRISGILFGLLRTARALSPSTWRPVDRVQRSSRGNSLLSDAASDTQPSFSLVWVEGREAGRLI